MNSKYNNLSVRARQFAFVVALNVLAVTSYSQNTYTFGFTGTVQALAIAGGNYEIECWGANGGDGGNTPPLDGVGGKGGYSKGVYNSSGPTTLYIYVGGKGASGTGVQYIAGGWNGGGRGANRSGNTSYYKGGGGGGTDVRTTQNTNYNDRVIVAGGGGGGGGGASTIAGYVGRGGNGGGIAGQNGILGGSQSVHNGKGGSQTAGGIGGGPHTSGDPGQAGGFGYGGDGGDNIHTPGVGSNTYPSGGGGGGWYGGGGGNTQGGSGGGGSSYIGGLSSAVTYTFGDPNYVPNPDVNGDGFVIIRELCTISLSVAGVNSVGDMCAGNTITITTNAVSNYSWTDGSTSNFLIVSPTTNTVYGLTATSPSNCMTSAQVSININALPMLNLHSTNPTVCKGNSAILSVDGADTFTWSTNAIANQVTVSPTQITTYTVIGRDAITECTTTESITVDVFTPQVAIIGNTNICSGVTASLTAYADGAIGYNWSTGLPVQTILESPASNTVYAVSAKISTLNANCMAYNTVTVTVHPLPNIVASADRFSMCVNETVNFTASGGTSYVWKWGQQTVSTPSLMLTAETMSNLLMLVTGTDANGCSNTASVAVQAYVCTGINEAQLENSLSVYPNPSQGEFNIDFNNHSHTGNIELLVISEIGQVVRKINLNEGNEYKTTISDLSSGIYFITGFSGTQKINGKITVSR